MYRLSSPLPQIEKGVDSLLAKLEENKLQKVLDFISQEMFGKSHATVAEKRVKDTGDWLLARREFQTWQIAPFAALLCLKGTSEFVISSFSIYAKKFDLSNNIPL